MSVKIVSENYFKNDNSDYAKSLRKIYGEDGYQKYSAKMNSIMAKENESESKEITNPIAKTKAEYIKRKEIEYKAALAAAGKAENIWNRYANTYSINLAKAQKSNNGYSLSSTQKQQVLANTADGASAAYRNFNQAQSDADMALSLYFDATHSGMSFLS